ncbi:MULTISPECIES: hypothetical protein [unclassified Blastococcus]
MAKHYIRAEYRFVINDQALAVKQSDAGTNSRSPRDFDTQDPFDCYAIQYTDGFGMPLRWHTSIAAYPCRKPEKGEDNQSFGVAPVSSPVGK